MTVSAVLLVPAKGDPDKLLDEGPCGARPPTAMWTTGTREWHPFVVSVRPYWDCRTHPDIRMALVLAWDGEPVAAGLDRLARMPGMLSSVEPWQWPDGVARAPAWLTQPQGLARIVKWLPEKVVHIGSVILLDDEGGEVSP